MYLEVLPNSNSDIETLRSIKYDSIFKDYKSLENHIKSIVINLQSKGYIDSFNSKIKRKNDSTYATILNIGAKIEHLIIHYKDSTLIDILNKNNIETKDDYSFKINIDNTEKTLNTINTFLVENGNSFSSVKLKHIKKKNSKLLSAELVINKNTKRYINDIVIKGYEKFPKSFLKHFLKLKQNDVLDLESIKNKTAQLNQLTFSQNKRDPEILFTKDSSVVYLYIEKTKANNFDGFLGFGTNETTNELDFDGYLDLRLINNLNFGERLNIFYKSDEIDQQTINIDSELPFLFKSPIGVQLGLNIFRKDSTFINAKQYFKLKYQINSNQSISAGISSLKSSNLQENTEFNTIEDFNSNFYNLEYNYSKLQLYDNLFPVNFFFNLSAAFGNRNNASGTENQYQFHIESYKIFNLNNRNSLFTRISASFLDSENFLDNELFRFGGINSIRGFEENSLVANLFGVLNTEYRYRLSTGIYVHSVIDAAYFENNITNTREKLFGFGFGFGLLTNAGLFRLNYTSGKTEDRAFRLSDSKVHISLTATF